MRLRKWLLVLAVVAAIAAVIAIPVAAEASAPVQVSVVPTAGNFVNTGLLLQGGGHVTSSPKGINCWVIPWSQGSAQPGPQCSAYFPFGSRVTLKAVADPDTSEFDGWGLYHSMRGFQQPCTGVGTCVLKLNTYAGWTVDAQFTPLMRFLRLNNPDPAHGEVISTHVGSMAGLQCGWPYNPLRCVVFYPDGMLVTLLVAWLPPVRGAVMKCDYGGVGNQTCQVVMNGDRTLDVEWF
jgi:hypothetical protein